MAARLHDSEVSPVNCIVCRHGATRPGTTSVTIRRKGRTLVVNHVPAQLCVNCGEAYVAEEITNRLLRIAAEARRAETAVLVRDFASATA